MYVVTMTIQSLPIPPSIQRSLDMIYTIEQLHSIASLKHCYNRYRSLLHFRNNSSINLITEHSVKNDLKTLKPLYLCYRTYLKAKTTVTKYKNANPNMLTNYNPDFEFRHLHFQSSYCIPCQQTNDQSHQLGSIDTSQCSLSNDSHTHTQNDNIYKQCSNCQRSQPKYLVDKYGIDSCFVLTFSSHPSSIIKDRRKFRFIKKDSNNITYYDLCYECSNFLVTQSNAKEANKSKYTWPGFIWTLLQQKDILHKYGSKVWQLIPTQWRHWWIRAVKDLNIYIYDDVTIDMPPPIIYDMTHDINDWNCNINSMLLSNLASTCNQYLMPCVLCPWGCTTFLHKCGHIQLDLVIQRYMPKCLITLINKHMYVANIQSARDDYVRFDADDSYDCWLLNPQWTIKPCICIHQDHGAVIMTCKDHNNGTKKLMIHPPRQPHHILSPYHPDQLCHAVIKPRTVKPMKSAQYSNSFQMHEQRGSFNGIDTCNLTTFRKFDFCSRLTSDAEARSIHLRPDINALLTQLCTDNVISPITVTSMRQYSTDHCQHINFDKLINASTYVPLCAAMTLQREINGTYINVTWDCRGQDKHGNDLPTLRRTVRKSWPTILYPLQKNDKFGVCFPVLPKFKSKSDTSFIWLISACMISVESLWQSVLKIDEFCQSQWHGWLLTYLTKHCYSHLQCRVMKKDPFKYSFVSNVDNLYDKLQYAFEYKDISLVFEDIDNIICVDTLSDMDDQVNTDLHDIIFVRNEHATPISDNDQLSFPYTKTISNNIYVLQCLVHINILHLEDTDEWKGTVYSQHNGQFNGWWRQSKSVNLCVQCNNIPRYLSFNPNDQFTAVYCKLSTIDHNELNLEYLKYLGGQSHVFCHRHQVPLVHSIDRSLTCQCGKKEYYTCPTLHCTGCICNKCCEALLPDTINYVYPNTYNSDVTYNDNSQHENHSIETNNNDCNTCPSDDDSLEEPYDVHGSPSMLYDDMSFDDSSDSSSSSQSVSTANDDISECFSNDEHELDMDEFDNYVTSAYNEYEFDSNEDNHDPPSFLTTDASDIPYTIEQKIKKKDVQVVCSHVMLNMNGTVLSRKKHQIKGSSLHKFFLQKPCSTRVGASIPTLYPEGMLFPSIYYHLTHDGAVSGAIPSPLLTECISQFGFQSLPQHIRSRLTSSYLQLAQTQDTYHSHMIQ